MRHEPLKPVDFADYEKLLQDHGNVYPYYPVDVVQKMFRPWLIQELQEDICVGTLENLKPVVEEIVNRCFQGKVEP